MVLFGRNRIRNHRGGVWCRSPKRSDCRSRSRCCSLPLLRANVACRRPGPTVAKDSAARERAHVERVQEDYDKWSWVPRFAFRVNGPIPSGGQLYADFSVPGGSSIKFDCQTQETAAGRSYQTECGGTASRKTRAPFTPARSASRSALRNELAGHRRHDLQRQSHDRKSAHERGRPQGKAQVRVLRRRKIGTCRSATSTSNPAT